MRISFQLVASHFDLVLSSIAILTITPTGLPVSTLFSIVQVAPQISSTLFTHTHTYIERERDEVGWS